MLLFLSCLAQLICHSDEKPTNTQEVGRPWRWGPLEWEALDRKIPFFLPSGPENCRPSLDACSVDHRSCVRWIAVASKLCTLECLFQHSEQWWHQFSHCWQVESCFRKTNIYSGGFSYQVTFNPWQKWQLDFLFILFIQEWNTLG